MSFLRSVNGQSKKVGAEPHERRKKTMIGEDLEEKGVYRWERSIGEQKLGRSPMSLNLLLPNLLGGTTRKKHYVLPPIWED